MGLFARAGIVRRPVRGVAAIVSVATVALFLLPAPPASAAVPGTPTGVAVTSLDSSLEVTWTAPVGGTPPTAYEAIAYSASSGGTAVAACASSSTNCTISGLVNGTTYYVAVDASNADGTGTESARVTSTAGGKPTAPRSVIVSRILNGVTVGWLAPSSDGGLPITGYTALAFTSTSPTAPSVASCTTTALSCTISGLVSSTTYYIAVQATNSSGTGPVTSRVTVTSGTAPTAPRSVRVTRGNGFAIVSWSTPLSNGGSVVTRYVARAYRALEGGDPIASCEPLTLSAGKCELGPLPNGATYYIDVIAINALAEGAASTPRLPIVPATVPTTPRTVTAARIGPNVHVQWTVPEADGGLPIESYVATAYRSLTGTTSVGSCTTSGDQCDIAKLTGAPVYVSVIARTEAGDSPASTPRIKVLLVDEADPPTDVAGSARTRAIAVSWRPPLSDGGVPVTSYLASAFTTPTGGIATSTCTLPVTPTNADQAASGSTERVGCSIHGLAQGAIYYLEVGALTDYGLTSTPTRTAVRVRQGKALPVRDVQGFPADHRIKVTWQLPASDGGQPITLYRVQAWSRSVDGRLTNTCTVRSSAVDSEFTCTITVADDFEPYWVEVAAQTTSGWGQSSARVPFEANPAVPPAPERVELAPRDLGLVVRWDAPSYDGGYPIYSYVARAYDAATGGAVLSQCAVKVPPHTSSTATTPTTCTMGGLATDQYVYVDVTAENTVGISVPSERVSQTIVPGRPGLPTGVSTRLTKNGLVVTWAAPPVSEGLAITDYRVYAYLARGGTVVGECSSTTTTCTITDPEARTATAVAVAAHNSLGWGDPALLTRLPTSG